MEQPNKSSNAQESSKGDLEIKSPQEGLEKIKNQVNKIINNLPTVNYLMDVYKESLSVDHYQSSRAEEVSRLMTLRAQLRMIIDEMDKYLNASQDSFGLNLQIPSIESIQKLKDLIKTDTGKKFYDTDNNKIFDLIQELDGIRNKTKELIDKELASVN